MHHSFSDFSVLEPEVATKMEHNTLKWKLPILTTNSPRTSLATCSTQATKRSNVKEKSRWLVSAKSHQRVSFLSKFWQSPETEKQSKLWTTKVSRSLMNKEMSLESQNQERLTSYHYDYHFSLSFIKIFLF